MSQQFTGQVVADLAPAIEAIQAAAKRIAAKRAEDVERVSSGAVQTTPDQLAAIEERVADELFARLAEQIRDVVRVHITAVHQE